MNQRPPAPEAGALPGYATPRKSVALSPRHSHRHVTNKTTSGARRQQWDDCVPAFTRCPDQGLDPIAAHSTGAGSRRATALSDDDDNSRTILRISRSPPIPSASRRSRGADRRHCLASRPARDETPERQDRSRRNRRTGESANTATPSRDSRHVLASPDAASEAARIPRSAGNTGAARRGGTRGTGSSIRPSATHFDRTPPLGGSLRARNTSDTASKTSRTPQPKIGALMGPDGILSRQIGAIHCATNAERPPSALFYRTQRPDMYRTASRGNTRPGRFELSAF